MADTPTPTPSSCRAPARAARGCGAFTAAVPIALALAGAVLGLVSSPPSAAAQERDTTRVAEPDTVRYSLEEISVETTRPVIASGGAAAVELSLDSAAVLPSPTLDEVLRDMPAVRVRRNSRGEVQPSLRGMEERQIAVLLDGVPITIGWDNRTDLSVVPLTAASEVRLVRGLSSVLAGPNALGGVVEVDITTGRFPDREPEFPIRLRGAVDHTGAVASSGEATHLWGRGEGGLWLRYGGGYREREGAALASGLPSVAQAGDPDLLLNSDLEHGDGFLALRWQDPGGGGDWVSFSGSGFAAERGVVPELHLLGGVDPEPRYWRIPRQWRAMGALSAGTGWDETPWGHGDLELSVGLDVQYVEIDAFESTAFASRASGETGDDRTLSFRLLGDHTLGPGTLRGGFTFADTRHEEVLAGQGPSLYRQRLWSLGLETEQPLDPGGEGALGDPRLTFGASVDGAATPETGDAPRRPAIWGWGARVVAQTEAADGRVALHGGLSRKVRFPSLRELFSGALGRFEPDPDLEALRLWVAEAGATLRAGGSGGEDAAMGRSGAATGANGQVQATLFQQRLLGSIVRAVLPDGRFQRQNRGETRATGLELVASGRVGGVRVRGDLTLQRVRLLDDGSEGARERPEYQPEVVAGAGVRAPLPVGFRGRVEAEFLGRQYGANVRTGEFEPIEPTLYLEAGLSRRFSEAPGGLPPLTLSLAAENVTDRVIYDQLGLPRPGRTVRLEVALF